MFIILGRVVNSSSLPGSGISLNVSPIICFLYMIMGSCFLGLPGSFNWDLSDTLVNWATSSGQLIRGYSLVWHSQLPGWVFAINDAATLVRCNLVS